MQIKAYLKGATGAATSKLAGKTDLGSSNAHWNKLDVNKMITTPADLSYLNNIEVNSVVKESCVW